MVLVFSNLQQFGVAAAGELMKKVYKADTPNSSVRAVSSLLTPRLEEPEQIDTAIQQGRAVLQEIVPLLIDGVAIPRRSNFSDAQLIEFETEALALMRSVVDGHKAPFHLVPTLKHVTNELGYTLDDLTTHFLPYRARMEVSARAMPVGMSLVAAFQLLRAGEKEGGGQTYRICNQVQHVTKLIWSEEEKR